MQENENSEEMLEQGSNKKKKWSIKGILWWIALIACIFGIFFGLSIFWNQHREEVENRELYESVVELHDSILNSDDYTEKYNKYIEAHVNGISDRTYLPECAELYELNNDLVAWLAIPNTNISYPVMQTSVDNRDFYLKHDFNKNYSNYGCLYASEDCDLFTPSDNVTIYGHYMQKPVMFHELHYYKEYSYWENHQIFTLDTLYEHHTYQVIAVFKVDVSHDDFYYHLFVNAENKGEFDEFIQNVKDRQFFETGYTAEYGDKLVCLSTCEYSYEDGRLVIVGKRIS